jgi:flagellar motor switch protein FliN/FliY
VERQPGEKTLTTPSQSPAGALDLLMDMEIPIQVRFGKTEMVLRDVLALEDGSVVEFHRPLEQPVEVLVNGRVVARGTVIAIQGNYGVRITEVAGAPEVPKEGEENG